MPDAILPPPPRRRWVSPLLRRVLLVNFVPLALLLATLLYLDQYQDGLLEAEVAALREQASIYAGALGESAVSLSDPNDPVLEPNQAARLLRRLTDPAPNAAAQLFGVDNNLIADSRVRPGTGDTGPVLSEPLPPAEDPGTVQNIVARISDWVLSVLPHTKHATVEIRPGGADTESPDAVREEIRLASNATSHELPPIIRRLQDGRLLVTVVQAVVHGGHNVGTLRLTRDAREVDASKASAPPSWASLPWPSCSRSS